MKKSEREAAGESDWRRALPSVERLLSSPEAATAAERYGRSQLKNALTQQLVGLRAAEPSGPLPPIDEIVSGAAARLAETSSLPIRRVINATGVLIHTNLGRAPIGSAILRDAAELIEGFSNLELDLESGQRGKRNEHLRELCQALFGCEAALLVNNNAAATMLAVGAIAPRREVVVSRGELVEIGGAFRVPEVIEQGGARLREVGTTNRTRASDYAMAVGEATGALLRVHRSNFDIVGFTEQPEIEELVAVGREYSVPLLYDEGSGRVVDLAKYGFRPAPTLRELFAAGVDVVTCSTDKLIGATQGGLILGRADLLQKCARHPLMRALRVGKESFAIIAATLQRFRREKQEEDVALYRMLAQSLDELRARAAVIAAGLQWSVREVRSAIGGGTTPTETMPSIALAWTESPNETAAALRRAATPVMGRIEDDALLLDLRSVLPEEDDALRSALQALM